MFVITGANGQTGSAIANTLLGRGKSVRVVLRRAEQAAAWEARGAAVCVADLANEADLVHAFAGAEAAYLMNPPAYQADDLLVRASVVHRALIAAAERAVVPRVVALSSVGAQHSSGTGNILTTHDFESRLAASRLAVTVLRAASFIENWRWFLGPALVNGQLPSLFQPLDRRLPMVSVRDIGEAAAALLENPTGGIVELHGPEEYSPHDAAVELTRLSRRTITAHTVPRAAWAEDFRKAGYSESAVNAFCEMFDGFNNGRVAFEGAHQARRGVATLGEALRGLVRDATIS